MRNKLYRSKDGLVFGVCQGLADHFDLNVIWIRFGVVISSFLTGLFPIPVFYAVAALIMKPAPDDLQTPHAASFEEDYFDPEIPPRTLSLRRLKNRFDSIEARIRRMENYVTNKSYDWERRFNADR